MSSEALKSLDELSEESRAYLKRFDTLSSRSPNDPGCATFVRELRQWLLICLAHGRYLATGSPERRALRSLVEEWNSRLRRDGHRVDGIGDLAAFDPDAGVVLDAECPYPGLEAYRAERSGSFFGRSELSKRYVERLVTNRIFLIVGASGSGKSSLALAGIRPKLQELHRDWLYPADFTPGATPLAALAAVVASAAGKPEAAEPLVRALREDPTSARVQLAQLCSRQSLMLVIDQFEELITLCRDPGEQAAFAAVLVALSEPPADDWACYTLLTLRTDHLARFDSSNALKPLYVRLVDNHNSELLTTLSFEEIKRAIAEPAKNVGLRFAPPTIIDSLASQTAGLANGLPLLQFALRRLWDTRPTDEQTGRPLDLVTQRMVDALPDVQGALGTVAEDTFQTFTERQRKISERALHELVLLDENFEEPLRRRRNRSELRAVLDSQFPGAEQDIAEIEGRFVAAGLLRISGEGVDQQIEVAHEALLRHWKRINHALSGDESKRRLHAVKQIAREAMEWEAHGRREDFVKQQGEPLQSALGYLADGWLAEAESKAYVEACVQRDAFMAEAVKAKKRTKWWVAAALVAALVVGIGVVLARIQRDAGLDAIASLGDRLPPWEALDVAYNVAKSGGVDYRFTLGHALERMDGSWLLGKRDAPLFPVGDGTALLQFDAAQGSENLLIYLIGPEGNPRDKAIRIDLRGRKDRLAQAQVGPAIKTGTYSGRHLLVLMFREEGRLRYIIETSLLNPQAGTATALRAKDDATALQGAEDGSKDDPPALQGAEDLSAVRIHPDGTRAIWSTINYGALKSQIHELSLGENGTPMIRAVRDPGPISTKAPNPITAVAYASEGNSAAALITGRLDGAVYCGDSKVDVDDSKRVDLSPVRTIISQPAAAVFAVGKFTGQVLAASCAKNSKAHALPLISSDPSSLRLTSVQLEGNSKLTRDWVMSYFDEEQQLRCYAIDPETLRETWWRCNAAHLIGAAALMTKQGQQLVVERADVAAIRRYPNEELSRREKQVHARQAGNSTLRWASRTRSDVGGLDKGDESPWAVERIDVKAKDGRQIERIDVKAKDGRQIEGAALSSDGKRVVWIEWLQKTVNRIGSMEIGKDKADPWIAQDGLALAVAIDKKGRIAHVQGSSSGSGKIMLKLSTDQRVVELDPRDGRPLCLAFSPNGQHLVLGTERGALRRFAGDMSSNQTILLSRNEKDKEGRALVSTTACAVADDGGVAAGYADGQVLYFSADGTPTLLTARSVYSFPVPIKDVRIDSSGAQQRVTALGEWQINNCTHPGLPGQTLRAWDVTLPERQRRTPDAVACFPNAAIAALGAWGQKPIDDASDQCPAADKGSVAVQHGFQVGLCLVTAQEPRWHACPACGRSGDTPDAILAGAIDSAAKKGAKPLNDAELERRYGFKLKVTPELEVGAHQP